MKAGTVLLRASTYAALAALCGCAGATSTTTLPPWLRLAPGTHARLGYSSSDDPEHALLYRSADDALAARSSPVVARARVLTAAAGSVVSVDAIGVQTVGGKHVAEVHGDDGVRGWVIAENELLPIPPAGTVFVIPNSVDHRQPMLYQEADDDDGTPFDAAAHVTYDGFANDPGNPEYQVRVDDGSLAGRTGYVMANELQSPQTHGFRLIPID